MRSKPVALLLADLSVTNNDNPYADGRAFCQSFFPWYNDQHRHSGIDMMPPVVVNHGLAATVRDNRQLSPNYQRRSG
jgi:putative transposase